MEWMRLVKQNNKYSKFYNWIIKSLNKIKSGSWAALYNACLKKRGDIRSPSLNESNQMNSITQAMCLGRFST